MEKQAKRARVDPGDNHMLQKLRRLQADGEHQGSAQTSDQRDDSVSGGEPPGVSLARPRGFSCEPGPEVQRLDKQGSRVEGAEVCTRY